MSVGADEPPLVLMVHEDRAWLVRGDWNRPVDPDHFRAFAAYSGVELRPIEGSRSQLVVLATDQQRALFELMWM